MFTNKELTDKWDAISFYDGGYKRIDNIHPLEWYIGYEDIDQKTILLITHDEYTNIQSSKSIIATIRQRQDGRWAISFKLIRKEQEDVFIRLCWDIIESSRDKTSGCNAIEFIIDRYNKWLKLMEHRSSELMSESLIKGLIGELIFLEERVKNGMTSQDAVIGWLGPDGAHQDFVYTNEWIEIKCIKKSKVSIGISSLEQLDAELPGYIYVYYIDKTSLHDKKGFTLEEKVQQLRDLFITDIRAKEMLDNKLFKYGYRDRKEYNEQRYLLCGKSKYGVDNDFPRLMKSNIPAHIISAKYIISLASIGPWEIK